MCFLVSFRANGEPTTRLPSEPTTGAVKNFEFSDASGNYNVTAEQEAFDNMPESLQDGERGQKAQDGLDLLQEAIEALESTEETLGEVIA